MSVSRTPLKRGLPLFMGITSPISVQGEVTVNVNVDQNEVGQRRGNMIHDTSRNRSYQLGDIEELWVTQGEAVFGWVDKQGRNRIPGNPSQIGFSAMNGIKYGRTTTDEELAGRIKFIGIAKADYHFDNPKQLRHGFACLAVGSTTTFNTGITDIQAGDVLEWNVVPRPVVNAPDPRAIMADGQFGDNGPGTRQGHPSYGTPHGKLRFRINASRFNDLTPSLNHAVSCMLRTTAQGGISDRPLEHLFVEGSLGMNTTKMTPAQEFAMSLLVSSMTTALRVNEICALNGGVVYNNPQQMGEAMGLFVTAPNDAQRNLREAVIAGLFMVPGAGIKGKQAMQAFRTTHPNGFKPGTNTLLRDQPTWDGKYAKVATQLGRYAEVGFARAVHVVARRRIGMALSPSARGTELDILVGHKQESY